MCLEGFTGEGVQGSLLEGGRPRGIRDVDAGPHRRIEQYEQQEEPGVEDIDSVLGPCVFSSDCGGAAGCSGCSL